MICGFVFTYRFKRESDAPPDICGFMRCRAAHEWSDEAWAGAVRMAHARRQAGVVLSTLDLAAIKRARR